jgi:thioredoxin 1
VTITVDVLFTPGCRKCAATIEKLRPVIEDLEVKGVEWRDVDILENFDYVIELGIIGPSALAIEGELVFPSLPKPNVLRRELERRLAVAT